METLMLDIEFNEDDGNFPELLRQYNKIGYDALYYDHYELSALTGHSPIDWKRFLQDPRIAAFVAEETEMLKKTKAMSMLRTVDSNRNVGQAQLLNTLLNQTKGEQKKEGPVFIYTHVPLNENEEHASNVVPFNYKRPTSMADDIEVEPEYENISKPKPIPAVEPIQTVEPIPTDGDLFLPEIDPIHHTLTPNMQPTPTDWGRHREI